MLSILSITFVLIEYSGFTPTSGLGCRSGGYLVYIIVALGLLAIEVLVWWLSHETTHTDNDILRRVGSRLERRYKYQSEKGLKGVSDLRGSK